jgi:uncharacterized damage-inducible protein DinB
MNHLSESEMEALRYPVGRYVKPETVSAEALASYVETIAAFPAKMRAATQGLSDEQLDTRYRPEGWTLRQVVNHCADSHINSFVRFKLTLTEELPTIKPYREELWAELADSKSYPIEGSLQILEQVHARWVAVLRSMTPAQWQRGFIHPEKNRRLNLDEAAALYAWHCDHHLGHITQTVMRHGWR